MYAIKRPASPIATRFQITLIFRILFVLFGFLLLKVYKNDKMLIKSIKIYGFKSYRNETIVGPFDEGFNVVVGRNGAGKSNFFSAIEFLLSEDYTNLTAQERSSMLSQSSSGQRILSAFVEIVFDNTSRRLDVNKDEIVLRRTIGAKKDQYHLDGKVISSRKELTGILESAGLFSRFNFFIVKQGKKKVFDFIMSSLLSSPVPCRVSRFQFIKKISRAGFKLMG